MMVVDKTLNATNNIILWAVANKVLFRRNVCLGKTDSGPDCWASPFPRIPILSLSDTLPTS